MVGKVSVILVRNLVWKADFFRKYYLTKLTFIYLKNIIWIYIYSGTPLARPPTGWHSIVRFSGAGRVTLAFLKVTFTIAITSML